MQSFSSSGVTIAFLDVSPTGPDRHAPIILVHGFASNHAVNWVNTGWVRLLAADGRRVIALDNRGHGQSERRYDPAAYAAPVMARDVLNLMDHLGIARADVMGYSMERASRPSLPMPIPAACAPPCSAASASNWLMASACHRPSPMPWRREALLT